MRPRILTLAVLLACLLVLVAPSVSTTINPVAAATLSKQSSDPSHGDSHHSVVVWSKFTDNTSGTAQIVVSDGRGRPVRQLTDPAPGVQDIDPRISPDGRLVAFERDDTVGGAEIVVVGIDGRGERVVDVGCTDPCALVQAPTWTPDGRHLVYTRIVGPFTPDAASAVLYRSDLHGRHQVRLSPAGIDGRFEDYHATFAPSGYIVFLRTRNASPQHPELNLAIFRMGPGGRHVRQLTPYSQNADIPNVSPARSGPTRDLIVFEVPSTATSTDAVATVPATCQPLSRCVSRTRYLTSLAPGPVSNFNPAWSPSGGRVVFVRFSFIAPGPAEGDIWTMLWNGQNQRAFSTSPLFEFRPFWGRAPRH